MSAARRDAPVPVVLARIDEPQTVREVVALPVVVGRVAVELEPAPLPDDVPDPVEEPRDGDEREADVEPPDPRAHRGQWYRCANRINARGAGAGDRAHPTR